MNLSLSSTIATVPDVLACELDGGAALLDLRSGIYFSLNGVGGRIWSMLETPALVDFIWQRLIAEYDVDPEACRQDLMSVLEKLLNQGLIRIEHEQASEVSSAAAVR